MTRARGGVREGATCRLVGAELHLRLRVHQLYRRHRSISEQNNHVNFFGSQQRLFYKGSRFPRSQDIVLLHHGKVETKRQ